MGDMIRANEKVEICFNNLSTILMKGNFQICLPTFDLETRNPGGVFLLLNSDYISCDSRAKPDLISTTVVLIDLPYRHDRRANTGPYRHDCHANGHFPIIAFSMKLPLLCSIISIYRGCQLSNSKSQSSLHNSL